MDPKFIEYMEEKYAIKTQINYLRSLRHLEANGVVLDDKESFKNWMRGQRSKGMKNLTIDIYLKGYNTYMDFKGQPRIKPLKSYDSVKRNRASMEDYGALLDACTGYTSLRDKLMIEILFKSGLRYNEMISLEIDDISKDKIVVKNGKNQKYREVPTFPTVFEAYEKYINSRKALVKNRNTKMLFINQYGEPITPEGGRNAVYRIARKAKISFSPHQARRFYARYLYDMGIKPELLQQLMGHEKLDTTLLYVQTDAQDAFSALRGNMKKLDFNESTIRANHNSVRMVRLGRDLNPSHGLDRPV